MFVLMRQMKMIIICVLIFLSFFGLVQGKKVNSTTWTLREKWMMRQILYIFA